MEHPGPRDVLFPAHSAEIHAFSHNPGNRWFFTYLALFLEDYARNPPSLEFVAKQALENLQVEGYRLLALGSEGIFEEMTKVQQLERVKGCFENHASALATHLQQQKLKKREQLMAENIHLVDYAEQMTQISEAAAPLAASKDSAFWVRPRGFNIPQEKKQQNDKLQKSTIVGTPATNADYPILASNALNNNNTSINNTNKKKKIAVKAKAPTAKSKRAKGNNIKSLDAIVIASMQQGVLPIGGNWKFFPLPELQNKVNLGSESNGWQLRLEPISVPGEPVILDVPFA